MPITQVPVFILRYVFEKVYLSHTKFYCTSHGLDWSEFAPLYVEITDFLAALCAALLDSKCCILNPKFRCAKRGNVSVWRTDRNIAPDRGLPERQMA